MGTLQSPGGRRVDVRCSTVDRKDYFTGFQGVYVIRGNLHGGCGRRRAALVLVGLVVLTAACSSTPPSEAGGTPVTPMSSPTSATHSPADSARQLATAAYTGMWQQMAKADETADWQAPALATYATGDALTVINRSLYTDHVNGLISTGAPTTNPQVTKVDPPNDPTTVMISDCGNDAQWVKHKADGSSYSDPPGGRRSITAEVKRQTDGSWRVTRFAVEGVGSC